MKSRSKKIIYVVGGILFSLVLLLSSLLLSPVQLFWVQYASSWFSEKTGAELSVGDFAFSPWGSLEVAHLLLLDRQRDTLVSVDTLRADFSLSQLYQEGRVALDSLSIYHLFVNLYKFAPDSFYNYHFIVEAFPADTSAPKSPSKFDLSIHAATLSDCRFSHQIHFPGYAAANYQVSRINAHLQLGSIRLQHFDSRMYHLSAQDSSGLQVDSLSFRFFSTPDSVLQVEDFYLALHQSFISIPHARYALPSGVYDGEIREARIILAELSRYLSRFSDYPFPLHFSASLSGDVPAMKIENLNGSYGDFCQLLFSEISSSDLSDWRFATYRVKNANFRINRTFSNRLPLFGFSISPSFHLFPSTLRIDGEGSVEQMNLSLLCFTPDGNCRLDGRTSHFLSRRTSHFDLAFTFDSLRWQPWVGVAYHQPADGKLTLSGSWNWNHLPNAQLSAQLNQFSYLDYTYAPIFIDLSMKEERELSLDVAMTDSNLTTHLTADLDAWRSDSLYLALYSRIESFSPASLHWTDAVGDLRSEAAIHIQGKGVDWKRWNGMILLDSLLMKRNDSHFSSGPIRLVQSSIDDKTQKVTLSAPFLDGIVRGQYDFSALPKQILGLIHRSLPALQLTDDTSRIVENPFSANLQIFPSDSLFQFFGWDCSLSDTLRMTAEVKQDSSRLAFSLPYFRWEEKYFKCPDFHFEQRGDSLALQAHLYYGLSDSDLQSWSGKISMQSQRNQIEGTAQLCSRPDSSLLFLPLHAVVRLSRNFNDEIEALMNWDSTSFYLNGQSMTLSPSQVRWRHNHIQLANFSLLRGTENLVSMEGVISASLSDTLRLSLRQLELKTLMSLWMTEDFYLNAILDGDIYASAILGNQMRFYTDNFLADSLSYNEIYWGDLTLNALWDNLQKGVSTRLSLRNDNREILKMGGLYIPPTKQVELSAKMDSIPLKYLTPFLSEYLFALNGLGEADLRVEGTVPNLSLRGKIFFQGAHIGVRYTGTTYSLSDTILLEGDQLKLSNFRIYDEKGKNLVLNGEIKHESFRKFNYQMNLNMKDFLLFNNARSTRNLLSGHFYANANNIRLIGNEQGAYLSGEFSNSDLSTLYIQLPDMPVEATSYRSIIYVEPAGDTLVSPLYSINNNSFDWEMDMMIDLTDKSTFYISLFDGAMIRGNGRIRMTYSDNKVLLYNRFQVADGYVKMKLSGLPQKNFGIAQGSFVEFSGDPRKLRFDATAVYRLTADLATLSPSFSSMGLSTTRVPVQCELNAVGTLDKMNLSYLVKLPDSSDEIVENLNSIINSDAVKIKEFAYLLGVGMFYDPSGRAKGDAFSSLASSSISSALNNSLADLLGNKVQLGAGFNSSKEDFSDLEMNLSVSTKLFKDRLLLKSSLGYQSQSADNGESSFLGNFDAEYLLTKSGMFRIKIYNHTNNDFYRIANNTQGIGFLFVKEAKRLRDFFRYRSSKANKPSIQSDSIALPVDTLSPRTQPK